MAVRTHFISQSETWACSVGVHIRGSKPKKRINRYQTGFKTKEEAQQWGKKTERKLFNYLKNIYPKRYPETFEESEQQKQTQAQYKQTCLQFWQKILAAPATEETAKQTDPYLEEIRQLEAKLKRLKTKQMAFSFNH